LHEIDRKLVAVAFCDVVGYSRLIRLDDVGTVHRLRSLRYNVMEPQVENYRGRIVQTAGDSALIVFESIVDAVRCAIAIQRRVPVRETDQPQDQDITVRIGIDISDVIVDGTNLHGTGVNIAVRLQSACPPGGICISGTVHEHVRTRLNLPIEDMGLLTLKNIGQPVQAWVLRAEQIRSLQPEPLPAHEHAAQIEGQPTQAVSQVSETESHIPTTSLTTEGYRPPEGARLSAYSFVQPTEGVPWIAVLPFRVLTPETVPGYVGIGLVDDLVCMLSTLREPVVVSSNSSLMFREQPISLPDVQRQLGVRYVLSGSLRRVATETLAAVELADAGSGAVLWARRFEFEQNLLFGMQDDLVALIVSTLVPRIQAAELRRARAKPPQELTAYELVLRARELTFQLQRPAFDEAGLLLRRAIALDPWYAAAHASLADWYNLRIGQGWSSAPNDDALTADQVALTAIENDPTNARALALRGHNRAFLYRDYLSARRLFEQALDAAPNDAAAWMWSACTSAYVGDGQEAVRRAERALRLSPLDPFGFRIYSTLCLSYYTAGSYEDAAHWGELAMQRSPYYTSNLRFTAAALVKLGRVERAHSVAQQIKDIQPDYRVSAAIERHPYRDQERRSEIANALIAAGLPR
jgi:class 3 adenylate cyclase/TolB-like protein